MKQYKPLSFPEWLSKQGYTDYEIMKLMEEEDKMPEGVHFIEYCSYEEYLEDQDIPYAYEMSNEEIDMLNTELNEESILINCYEEDRL